LGCHTLITQDGLLGAAAVACSAQRELSSHRERERANGAGYDHAHNAAAPLPKPSPISPAELAALIKAEGATWGPIIRSTGFKPLE
jgi:hypothetical protein